MISLAVAVAALAAAASATGYLDGHEYVYTYKGQIYTGYPRIKPQYSGYEFTADLILQPQGDYALLKVDNVKKTQFNEENENVAKHPERMYSPLPPFGEVLTKPFKVYRKNGMVSKFEVTKGEPSFSVNLKRGLVALFNLNFEEADAVHSTEDNDIQSPDPDRHYYEVYEKGILGDCETSYVIEHHPYYKTPQNNIVLNVTKTRNYHKCKVVPNQVYGVFHGYECSKEDHEKSHTLHGNAQYQYNIRGYRNNYIIEKISTTGEVAYTPYPIEGQTVATTINRYLTLREERLVSTPMVFGPDADTYDSVIYHFDHQKNFKDPVDLKKPHYLYHITGFKVPQEMIKPQFEELLQAYNDDTYQENLKDKNFPAKFAELVRSLATVGYEEIEDLFKTYAEIPKTAASADQKRKRSLFMDTLVNLGTNPAVLFATYLIENKKVEDMEATRFYTQLPLHVKEVSEVLLDKLQASCNLENIKKHPAVHQHCMLALSKIIFEHCVVRYHPEGPEAASVRTCQIEDAVKYFEDIAKKFEQAVHVKAKVGYMKAMGNLGLREMIPYVRPYIEGHGMHHRYLRESALWSIAHVGYRNPEKVRDLLVPLMFNQTEPSELRLAAYIILTMYRPQMYKLEGLARFLKTEKDDQVRSYIYSSIKAMANSTHPCDRKSALNAQHALRILNEDRHEYEKYDYSYSKTHYVAGYDHKYGYGGSTRFSYFASDSGYVPRIVYLGIEDLIGGKTMQTFSIGLQQYGMDKIWDKLFGPEGTAGRRSLFDLFKKKRGKRDTAVEKELNEIKGKINLPIIEYEPLYGEIFVLHMGESIAYFPFDDKTFEEFLKSGRFSIPNLLPTVLQKIPAFGYQRFMLSVDQFYVIPSESGIPLLFDYKQPVYLQYSNKETSFKVEPGFFAEERGGNWPDSVKAETDGYLAMDKNLFASMGAIIPFDQVIVGAGINRRSTLSLPLKLKLNLDEKEKKLNLKWTPVPHDIYHFKYEPYTFADSYVNTVPVTMEKGYLPVKRHSRKHIHEKYAHDLLGYGFDVDAEYENEFNDKGSWMKFLTHKDYREKFYYLYANPNFEPYDVNVRFSPAQQGATKQVDMTIKYNFLNTEYSQPEFSTNNFEDFKLEGGDRSGPFFSNALEIEAVLSGDKERKIHTDLSWTRDLKRTYHKINFFYDRTPFSSKETAHLKMCGSAFLKYPKWDLLKVATLDTLGLDPTVESKLKWHFGKDCSSDQKISVHGVFKKTDEQRYLESKREEKDTPEHYNPYAYLYQKCLKERQKGINYGEYCMRYFQLIDKVHAYDFHAKFQNLSPKFQNITNKIGGALKHCLYNYADINTIDVNNPADEFHLHANFSLRMPVGDIRVHKPKSNSHYTHVHMPNYHGFNAYPMFEDLHVKKSFSDLHCKLEGDNVVTFDRYEYTLPPFDCYKVIARDCTPNEYFTILGTKVKHQTYHKAVKVFIGKYKVEALPVSEDSDIIIRVDGTKVQVSNDEPYLKYETEDRKGLPIFYITKRDFYYALHSEKYGLIVEYDGHNIIVQVSPYYRSKLCGICGNYNGQKYDGYATADGCYYLDSKAYAYAYAIPSDACSVPKFEKTCPKDDGFGCTKLRTKVVSKGAQSCFSHEPIPECNAHCKARNMNPRKVSFHCLPSKDDSTKSLIRQQQHRIIHEVKRKSKDHEEEVQVPDVCLKV